MASPGSQAETAAGNAAGVPKTGADTQLAVNEAHGTLVLAGFIDAMGAFLSVIFPCGKPRLPNTAALLTESPLYPLGVFRTRHGA